SLRREFFTLITTTSQIMANIVRFWGECIQLFDAVQLNIPKAVKTTDSVFGKPQLEVPPCNFCDKDIA
ncbi:MAG: hypothetical protein ACLGHN_16425, partial [Bacteriovoracia bacterium]